MTTTDNTKAIAVSPKTAELKMELFEYTEIIVHESFQFSGS